jgi:hypothetical protein
MSTTALVLLLSAGLPASTSQATTEHFVVKSYSPAVDAAQLARHAEAMRREVAALWLDDQATATWNPRCEIVVHSTRTSYRRAVGGDGSSTVGSTLVRFSEGRIVVRRIDLLGERADSPFETVAHELVHVIFAERFRKTAPPRWAEEGAALMADSHAKRLAHRRDFAVALRDGSAFRVSELVRMSDYPPPTRCAAFYGQSLVLVDFLMRLGEPADFARFVDRSLEAGHDRALREVYGIASTQQLESLWRERAVNAVLAAN